MGAAVEAPKHMDKRETASFHRAYDFLPPPEAPAKETTVTIPTPPYLLEKKRNTKGVASLAAAIRGKQAHFRTQLQQNTKDKLHAQHVRQLKADQLLLAKLESKRNAVLRESHNKLYANNNILPREEVALLIKNEIKQKDKEHLKGNWNKVYDNERIELDKRSLNEKLQYDLLNDNSTNTNII